MRDDQPGVERFADAVAGEVADHAVAETLGVGLDGPADDVDFAARHHSLDGAAQGLLGALDQQARLLVDVPDHEHGVGVAVDAVR